MDKPKVKRRRYPMPLGVQLQIAQENHGKKIAIHFVEGLEPSVGICRGISETLPRMLHIETDDGEEFLYAFKIKEIKPLE